MYGVFFIAMIRCGGSEGTLNMQKKSIYVIVGVLTTFLLGTFVGVKYLAPQLIQHHYHETVSSIVERPTIIQSEVRTVTDTQIAYVPKEIVVTKYIDKMTGKEVAKEEVEKNDIQADIGKQEIYVKLNGKEVLFQKKEDEKFVLEKNKISLQQTSKVEFNAKIIPPAVDYTKRWGIGIGYSKDGVAGKLDFPIGANNSIGGWVYGDRNTAAGGVEFKF